MKSPLLGIALVIAGGVASAQPAGEPRGLGAGPGRIPKPFVLMGGEGAFERDTIRGQPYSAKTETELGQTLADGNRIKGSWTGFIARDSEGRVRREQPLAAIGALLAEPGPPRLTVINDPVQRVTYFLDTESRTVRRMAWPPEGEKGLRGASKPGAERGGGREGGGQPAPIFERGGPFGLLRGTTATPSTEALGGREIAGVTAQGTRTTYLIPAGQIGNERPLSIVSERWWSAELGIVLETRFSDPRMGETRFCLTELERREPDHALFEVPAGYARRGRPAASSAPGAASTVATSHRRHKPPGVRGPCVRISRRMLGRQPAVAGAPFGFAKCCPYLAAGTRVAVISMGPIGPPSNSTLSPDPRRSRTGARCHREQLHCWPPEVARPAPA